MDAKFMKKVEDSFVKREVDVRPGDRVKVHVRIEEAGKERTQIFEGIVLSLKGTGLGKTFTVRKISHGIGVEKIFPFQSPMIKKVDVVERGKKVRRSKLYYMRKRIGKRSLDVALDEQFEAIMGMDDEEFAEMREAIEEEEKEEGAEGEESMAPGSQEEAAEASEEVADETQESEKMTEEKVAAAQEAKEDDSDEEEKVDASEKEEKEE
jgi:large subunit ribosomal protein L19